MSAKQSQISNLPFVLSPLARKQAEPYLQYMDTEFYFDKPTNNKCPRCKTNRTRRTFAQGIDISGRDCKICFDYCPSCRRVKPTTKHQEKMMSFVKNIQPLDPSYVSLQNNLNKEIAKGRLFITRTEFISWQNAASNQQLTQDKEVNQ